VHRSAERLQERCEGAPAKKSEPKDNKNQTTYDPRESTMSTMLRWSPTRKFHFHHDADDLFLRFFEGVTPNETVQRPASWLPAAEGRIEDGTYVIQLALPGVDPKDVAVSLMDNVLTVKGERKPGPDTMDKDYFVREVAYGGFERSFALPEGVDATQVEAKYANGMLEVRIPAPRAAMPTTIEVKAA
jgi:HSP20 family protein